MERGVRVYYLRNTQLQETLRQHNNAEKSEQNDAKMLAMVPSDYWKELTKETLILRSFLHQYYVLADNIKRNKQWLSLMIGEEAKALVKERINFLIRQRECLGRRILETAKKTLPYDYVRRRLGIQGVSLVTLLTYVDFSKTFRQLTMFAGFVDPKIRSGRFSRKVRRALRALTVMAIRNKHQRYLELYSHYSEKLERRNRAILRVQQRLLKDIWQVLRVGQNHTDVGRVGS